MHKHLICQCAGVSHAITFILKFTYFLLKGERKKEEKRERKCPSGGLLLEYLGLDQARSSERLLDLSVGGRDPDS